MRHALLALVVCLIACGGSRSAAGRATRGSADRPARAMSLSEQRRAEGDELLAIVARAAGAWAADVVPVGAVGDKGIRGQAHFIRKYFSQRPALRSFHFRYLLLSNRTVYAPRGQNLNISTYAGAHW